MADLKQEIQRFFREGDPLSRLIATLLGVYVVILLLQIISRFTQFPLDSYVLPYFTLPTALSKLLLKPWTIFTYMFVHEGFMHILFNLLYLFFAGQLFQSYLGSDKLWSTFILGGLAGGILYVLAYNIFPFFEGALPLATNRGASAGVMAVLVSVAVMAPYFPVRLFFVLEVKLWQVVAMLILLDLVYMPQENPGGHIAHIGGAAFGFFMARQWRDKRVFIGEFMNNWIEGITEYFKGGRKMKVAYSSKGSKTSGASRPTSKNAKSAQDQEKLNAILDKISKGGYDSLSKEEKDFLFRMSNQ